MTEIVVHPKDVDAHVAFVGRQPIYGRSLDVFAYELLFRNNEVNRASFTDGDAATAQVMLNTFVEIGLDSIVDHHLAFINLTRDFVLGGYCMALPKDRVVLEVLENMGMDHELMEALRRLSTLGYRIALDDFVYHDSLKPLVELADIIKVDVLQLDKKTVSDHVEILREYPVKLLAEKVETYEEFEFCCDLGFDYFQGYFFCKPKVISAKPMPANRMAVLALLTKLQEPTLGLSQLERMIQKDLSLGAQVLRYINAAYFEMPKYIDSLDQAISMVGTNRLRTWASLLMLTRIEDKPVELLVTGIVRARMCEQLALAHHVQEVDHYFTVGLFSILDGLLDQPMNDIISILPLDTDIRKALLKQEGVLGRTLECVLAYERGDWDTVLCHGVEVETVKAAYLESISWTSYLIPLLKS
ncbi:EAL and HDOD domain-containing protein [Candidatus Nitronereus thalassa]|uniref:EAL domain-containing protein n=1 Tax=Candidatus Nitronereus thalassa TaxID=3020898 RepID=A0ABU3K4U0_9BACT|nr:EAL domain-containing protein [Candidatus Nitronereus thalassa]MDT7041401.1 EAL domain-containing protein [Candidatus Nitronereus thalassa]